MCHVSQVDITWNRSDHYGKLFSVSRKNSKNTFLGFFKRLLLIGGSVAGIFNAQRF